MPYKRAPAPPKSTDRLRRKRGKKARAGKKDRVGTNRNTRAMLRDQLGMEMTTVNEDMKRAKRESRKPKTAGGN